jgi:hypothetical protein
MNEVPWDLDVLLSPVKDAKRSDAYRDLENLRRLGGVGFAETGDERHSRRLCVDRSWQPG